jgi:DNA-binding NtrC family response regulator
MVPGMPRVLVVDDEPGVQESLRMLLKEDCEVTTAGNADEALAAVDQSTPDLVILDLVMPGRSGLEVLTELGERGVRAPVIVLTATKTVATAVEAMKRGAADYITKPFEVDALRLKVSRLLEQGALREEVARLRDEVSGRQRLGDLIGKSAVMQELFRSIERVAQARASVLIQGESGTGKELVARALHDLSPRSDGPFVAVNCAAIPDTLLESELFGHERGAFTDAREQRIGRFEAATGGTLFLDEIGEIAPAVQAKLLRALQERTIERLGSTEPIEVDARIVAATNRDLEASIAAGTFRSDLYYRINVVPLALPPLRARREDIPLLVENVLLRVEQESARPIEGLSAEAWEVLAQHSWPGNVRELENAIERAATLADGPVLEPADLPDAVTDGARVTLLRDQVRSGRIGFEDAVMRFESELLREALEATDWNQTRAAERLGITRRLLKLRMDRCGLTPPEAPAAARDAH